MSIEIRFRLVYMIMRMFRTITFMIHHKTTKQVKGFEVLKHYRETKQWCAFVVNISTKIPTSFQIL